MGVRHNWIRNSNPFSLLLNVPPINLPSRFVLPGPLGTSKWHRAAKENERGIHLTDRLFLATQDLDYEKLYRDIMRWEGVVRHMYLDSHNPPLVTVGTGNMLPNVEAAQSLPFVNMETNQPAKPEEVAIAFNKVASMAGGLSPPSKYKLKPNLEISEEKAKELAFSRLKKEFIPGIKKWVKGFDRFPLPAREALIDMAYNGGVGRESRLLNGKVERAKGLHMYINLKRAVEAGDWLAAARACHSSSSRETRNQWRRQLFENAARIAAHATRSWP